MKFDIAVDFYNKYFGLSEITYGELIETEDEYILEAENAYLAVSDEPLVVFGTMFEEHTDFKSRLKFTYVKAKNGHRDGKYTALAYYKDGVYSEIEFYCSKLFIEII